MLMGSCHVMWQTHGDMHLKVMKTEAEGFSSVNGDSKTVEALHLDGIKANIVGVMADVILHRFKKALVPT